MASLFKRVEVPRTNVASHNPVLYGDHGESLCEFYTPSSKYFGKQICPWDNQWSDGTPSFMAPISHYHLLQTESFHIESGSGYWYLQGKKILLKAGDDIIISRCLPHRFESVPTDKKEPLVILYRYDSQRWDMEERFFRSTLTYFDDCRKHGIAPSLLQICVFLSDAWMPGDIVPCPIPGLIRDYLRCAINTLFIWTIAFIGRFLYGYKGSYIEYYDSAVSKKRMLEESKKGQ